MYVVRARRPGADDSENRLTKPRGALGRLEALSVQLAGIAGVCPAPVPAPAAVAVFAADHGVVLHHPLELAGLEQVA